MMDPDKICRYRAKALADTDKSRERIQLDKDKTHLVKEFLDAGVWVGGRVIA